MNNIIIGKQALESLTTGMYADPFVIFREYIQNAADSIDDAFRAGILNNSEDRIDIDLSPTERRIMIKDNGMGVACIAAEKTLISIGNSKKSSRSARGFRGIGRLAALGYCGKLVFESSASQEKKGTRILIDARKLSERLSLEEHEDIPAEEVLQGVYSVEFFNENKNKHYFNVIMEEVEPELMSYDDVYTYLIQNVPVAFDSQKFAWGEEIKRRIEKEGYSIPEYNIFLSYGGNTTKIFKPYEDTFFIDKGRTVTDNIKDIEIIKLYTEEKKLAVIGWIAQTEYLGSIYDRNKKGIRIRKGNIMIGDGQTLNMVFKEPRFNGWVIGELYAIDQLLIPNARRDNFEKNASYFVLIEQLKNIAATITKNIRNASLMRNDELSKVIGKVEMVKEEAKRVIDSEILNSNEKVSIRKRLQETQYALNNFTSRDVADLYNREIAFDQIDMLIGKLQGITAYKALNAIQFLSKSEKKILEKVFDVIVSVEPDESEQLIDSILKAFTAK